MKNNLFTYTLRIADDSLILGQRLSAWCGHGPIIEEDIAFLTDLYDYLDLVALGTICDVVPLIDLNRAFVYQGIQILKKRKNLGIKTLMDVADIKESPSTYHIGFLLGPRINAGGRIGQSDLGANLLTTEDPKNEAVKVMLSTSYTRPCHHAGSLID